MVCQARVQFPVQAIVIADPEAGRVNANIDRSRLAGTTWFNNPDVVQLFAAILWKLDPALWLLPRLAKVIAETQIGTEKVAVFSREQPPTTTLVKSGIEDAATLQHWSLNLPSFAVGGSQKKQSAFGPDHQDNCTFFVCVVLCHVVFLL